MKRNDTCEVELYLEKIEWGRVIENKLTIHRPYVFAFSVMKLNLTCKRHELKSFDHPSSLHYFKLHRKEKNQCSEAFGSKSYFAL